MEYLVILIAVFVGCLILEKTQHIQLYKSYRERLEIAGMFFVFGSIWDSYAIWRGHWVFPPEKTLGIVIGLMPIEEYLFMLIIPYGILTVYKYLDSKYRSQNTYMTKKSGRYRS